MNIYEAIGSIMKKGCAIGKDKRNEQQRFMYRGIDDVMNVFNPLLAEHGVFVVPEVLEAKREERQTSKGGNLLYSILKVKYSFYAEDGSHVDAVVIGEGMDSADKASNKALSAAMKYAMFQVFCIPTEEMKDPDAETPEPSRPAPRQEDGERRRDPEPPRREPQTGGKGAPTAVPRPGDNGAQKPRREPQESVDGYLHCDRCGGVISKTKRLTAWQVAETALCEFGEQLCWECGSKAFNERTERGA